MTRLASILTCLVLAACGAAPAEEMRPVALGAEFTLAPGESATLTDSPVKVRFVAVTDDSRCPSDTTCIWAGEVKVRLDIEVAQDAFRPEMTEGGSISAGDYSVTLVRVEPQPVSTAKIAPRDYRATLKIDRRSALVHLN